MKNSGIALLAFVAAATTAAPVFAGGHGHGGPQGASRGATVARPAASSFRPGSNTRFTGARNFGTGRQFSNFQVNRSSPHQQFSARSLQRQTRMSPRFGMSPARNVTA